MGSEVKKQDEAKVENKEEGTANILAKIVDNFLGDKKTDPLWRSFAFYFILYNWKVFVALFFGKVDNPNERIANISKILHENILCPFFTNKYWLPSLHFIIVPFLFAAFSILIYLRFIKPFFVEQYTNNNRLSDLAMTKLIHQLGDNLNKQINEINDLGNEVNKQRNEMNAIRNGIKNLQNKELNK